MYCWIVEKKGVVKNPDPTKRSADESQTPASDDYAPAVFQSSVEIGLKPIPPYDPVMFARAKLLGAIQVIQFISCGVRQPVAPNATNELVILTRRPVNKVFGIQK